MTNEELYYLPASELLKHIQAEKDRLIKEKVIKKSKPLPLITDEEKPYELPVEWEWIRLGDLSTLVTKQTGFDYSKHIKPNLLTYEEKNTIPMLQTKNFSGKDFNFKTDYHIPIDIAKNFPNILLDKESLLISIVGASVGNVGYYTSNITALLGGAICRIVLLNKNLYPFIYYYLKSPIGQKEIKKNIKSTAQETITVQNVREICIPLPPLYIQDQIVQKLEQLSQTKDSLLSHAESQLNYTKKMRQVLLQEAIRGELVPQDEDDEPASVLLEKIKSEKERLIKEKVIKKQKELPPITEEEKPYELPDKWVWVRLGEICTKVTDGSHNPPKNKGEGIPMISAKNIVNGSINLKLSDRYVNELEFEKEDKRTQIRKDDILISIVGTIGRTAIVPTNDKIAAQRSVGILKTLVYNKYLKYVLDAPLTQLSMFEQSAGTAQRGIYLETLKNVLIPLPPLAEQERIVIKLDELMANCNQLEVKAEEMKNYTSKLFEASLKEAFKPE